MTPRASKPGASFKGACLYMSRDKGAETSNRLGFVEFVNLPIQTTGDGAADSDRAAKVMAFTALHWEDLQRTHHQSLNTGKPYRKPPKPPTKPVYTYSLRFAPEDYDKITPEFLSLAAHESLKALGLADGTDRDGNRVYGHEAVIYEHGYEDWEREKWDVDQDGNVIEHPNHVHVVVSKINPVTGRTNSLHNDHLTLSRFAERFSKEHGLRPLEQRIENNKRRDAGEYVYYDDLSRSEYERFKTYRGKTEHTIRQDRQTQQEADIAELSARQRAERDTFNQQQKSFYAPVQNYFNESLAESQRTIGLDHLTGIFRIITRLKQRLTGELKCELSRIKTLEASIAAISRTIKTEREHFSEQQAKARKRLRRRHAAELKRDDAYFEWRKRRSGKSSATDGEDKPPAWIKTIERREDKRLSQHVPQDPLSVLPFIGKTPEKAPVKSPDPDTADLTPETFVQRAFVDADKPKRPRPKRKRTEGRTRKPRPRSPKR